MAWVKLDDGFFLHPKAIAAGRDGRDVFITALCWANQQMTDGVIPAHALPLIGTLAGVVDYDAAASRLVQVGLWHHHVEGWSVHQFLESQQSKEQRQEWLRRDRERKQVAREALKANRVPESVRPDSARNPAIVRSREVEVEVDSKSSSKSSSSSSFGPLSSAAPTAPTDDDDDRISEALKTLGRADHTKAIADGVQVYSRQSHLDECIRRREPDRTSAQRLALEHPDWDAGQIAQHIQDPDAAKKAAAQARVAQAFKDRHGPR